MRTILYALLAYLSGSVLYAQIFARLFHKPDLIERSNDHNPGTANAFQYGGFWCGVLTLVCDLLKGFFPVYLYSRALDLSLFPAGNGPAIPVVSGGGLALVLAAPVLGHIFPLWHRFRGGKGITVTFGVLLGLLPKAGPVVILACVFLFFSLVVKITPNCHRTLFTYLVSAVLMVVFFPETPVSAGFWIITAAVAAKLLSGSEIRERCEVKALWKH